MFHSNGFVLESQYEYILHVPQTSSAPSTSNSETAGKQTLMFIHSEKAPKYEEIMSKLDKMEIFSNFCCLLRKPQLFDE